MSIISDLTSAIKLLVDVYNSIRGVKKDSLDSNKKIFSPKAIEETHHQLKYLLSSIKNLERSVKKDDKDSIQKEYSDFIFNLSHLLIRIRGININLIEIYSPGLGHKMAIAFGADSIIYSFFHRQKLPSIEIDVKNSSKTKKHLLKVNEEFEKLDMIKHWQKKEKIPRDKQEFMETLHNLKETVIQINLVLEDFMKTNWSPKDLS